MRLPAILLLLSVFARAAEPTAVLAKSGDIEIRAGELREIVAGLDDAQQAALDKDPAALGQYVRALLIQRLVLKQALEQKWDQEPKVIAKLVRARETALTESFLAANSTPEAGYPTDSELTEAYESNKEKFLSPRSLQLAQIFVASDKSKLESILKQLKAKGADFAAIASANSEESASAAKGGSLGWLTEEQIQPEIRAKLPKLTLGTVTEPIKLKDGWHILKVLDIREAHTPALEEIRGSLAAKLRSERVQLKQREYLASLVKNAPVAINEIELSKLRPSPEKTGN